jgi:hypothetical protein
MTKFKNIVSNCVYLIDKVVLSNHGPKKKKKNCLYKFIIFKHAKPNVAAFPHFYFTLHLKFEFNQNKINIKNNSVKRKKITNH